MGSRAEQTTSGRRYSRDTAEFARVANLSDAVFAIAMTLLVLTLETPDVPVAELAGALADDVPQLGAFLLSFGLVANIWWIHHKFFAQLAWIEPGIVAINLAGLCGVALVPFPTSLVGSNPTAVAAVVPFIAVFVVLNLLYLWMMERAHRAGAWTDPMPAGLFPWIRAGWLLSGAMMMAALILAVWWPLGGLLVLIVSSIPELLLGRRAPAGYRQWA
jgi:uncharacterized membrane protein